MFVVHNKAYLNEDLWIVKESTAEEVIEQLKKAKSIWTTLEDSFYTNWLSKKLGVTLLINEEHVLLDTSFKGGVFLLKYTYTSLKRRGTEGIKFYRVIPVQ